MYQPWNRTSATFCVQPVYTTLFVLYTYCRLTCFSCLSSNFIVNITYTHCTTDNQSMRTLRLSFISVIFQAHLGWYCSYIAASCTKILLYVHMRPVITLNYISVKYIRYDVRHIYIYIIYIYIYIYSVGLRENLAIQLTSVGLAHTYAPNTSLPMLLQFWKYCNSMGSKYSMKEPFIRYQLHNLSGYEPQGYFNQDVFLVSWCSFSIIGSSFSWVKKGQV